MLWWEITKTGEKSTRNISFSSSASSWHLSQLQNKGSISSGSVILCWRWNSLSDQFAVSALQYGRVAVCVQARWFVADNYRWIYWDFLLVRGKVLHDGWRKELEVVPSSPSSPLSSLSPPAGVRALRSRAFVEFCALLLRGSSYHVSRLPAPTLSSSWVVLHVLIVVSSCVCEITPKGYIFHEELNASRTVSSPVTVPHGGWRPCQVHAVILHGTVAGTS